MSAKDRVHASFGQTEVLDLAFRDQILNGARSKESPAEAKQSAKRDRAAWAVC